MTYAETIQFLYGLNLFGANFGLEPTQKLAALAGNPQDHLRFIHVAGTNGKGSTCAMLESIYRAAGLRVGLFTSPHLVSFRERIQVNRQGIPEADVVRLVNELRLANHDNAATLFEFTTVMALKYFAGQACDLVIWETGLGGRLDATNIVIPLASIITNIGLDHQQWLGDTLEKIAAEKAGIIKPGIPVLTAAESPALEVIAALAREKNAPFTHLNPLLQVNPLPGQSDLLESLPLLGDHQKTNAALALAAVAVLQPRIPVSAPALRAGLASVSWPGRLQLVRRPEGGQILLDGAHNLAGAEVLSRALAKYFPASKRTLVLGILQDKDWQLICRQLAPLAEKSLRFPLRAAARSNRRNWRRSVVPPTRPRKLFLGDTLQAELAQTAGDPFVVVTGSLYLVGKPWNCWGFPRRAATNAG